jgi:flagellar FliJ protein
VRRAFPLAGLLRLRHLQQDQAAGDLSAANSRAQATGASLLRARSALDGIASAATNVETLYAIAAARASSRSMLADLDALSRNQESAVAEAQAAFDAARAESIGLEKLEDRHATAVATEELQAEQVVLDEIASVGWHRDKSGADR